MDPGAAIAVGTFMCGIVFYAGRLTTRVERLEEWRDEQRAQHVENQRALEAIRLELVGLRGE